MIGIRRFSEKKTSAILSARLSLKKDDDSAANTPPAITPVNMQQGLPKAAPPVNTARKSEILEENFSLEDYLRRIENAANHYEFFDVDKDAPVTEIKTAYFALAKRFHPDLYYKDTGAETHSRVQDAFTKIAHAYEVLKVESSREVYNYKMRKELERNETASANGSPDISGLDKQMQQAAEDFNNGYNYLMEENIEAALPFFARAVHFDNKNARYHAYYGKVLSFDKSQYHKAEAEFHAAVKLDAKNADFRIMLAEFFIQVGLLKRAEGELNRLLAIFPDNREAKTLLDSLAKT